ncbi:MAG: cupin domain-containing protein [Acidimicrobiia bacterium]
MSEREISFDGARMRVLLGEDAGAGLTVLDEIAPPGMSPPPHAHVGVSETFYVLEGSYKFVVDGREQEVRSGELVSVPPGMTHSWTAGSHGARSLIFFVPGGMEGYFVELAHALSAAGDQPLEESFHARMRERYGTELRR